MSNGNTVTLQAPSGLASSYVFQFPDLTGISSNPSFILSNSTSGQQIAGGLTLLNDLYLAYSPFLNATGDVLLKTDRITGRVMPAGITINSTGNFDFGGKTITNVGNPTNPGDVVTLSYAQSNFMTSSSGNATNLTVSNNLFLTALSPGVLRVGAGGLVGSGPVDLATTDVTGTLNDGHVADNLTINGGTVNNTPIGSTTPATGAFTTLATNGTTNLNAGTSTGSTAIGNTTNGGDVQINTPAGHTISMNGTSMLNGPTTLTNDLYLAYSPFINPTADVLLKTDKITGHVIPSGITITGAGNFDFGNKSLTNIANPVNPGDAVSLGYAQSNFMTTGSSSTTNLTVSNNLSLPGLSAGLLHVGAAGAVTSGPADLATDVTGTLSDSRVADNLTISGGTVNSTPIGATTPSTGSFTALTTSGATNLNTGTSTGATTIGNTTNGGDVQINTSTGHTITMNGPASISNDLYLAYSPFVNATGDVLLKTDKATGRVVPAGITVTGAGNFDIGGKTITNVASPTGSSDAVTLGYAQSNFLSSNSTTNFTVSNTLSLPGLSTGVLHVGAGGAVTSGPVDLTTEVTGTLPDSRIADNLMISGGTVNNTPIGATTPSTGAFTSLTGNGAVNLNAGTGTGTTTIGNTSSGGDVQINTSTGHTITMNGPVTMNSALTLNSALILNGTLNLSGALTTGPIHASTSANNTQAVFGDASLPATSTSTIGVLAMGNGSGAAATTNSALQVVKGEFNIGRSGNDADGSSTTAAGPSGIVDVSTTAPALVSLNTSTTVLSLVTVLTGISLGGGPAITHGTLTVNTPYAKTNSIILCTVSTGGSATIGTQEQVTARISNRANGSFQVTVDRGCDALLGTGGGASGNVRVGYLIVNPDR